MFSSKGGTNIRRLARLHPLSTSKHPPTYPSGFCSTTRRPLMSSTRPEGAQQGEKSKDERLIFAPGANNPSEDKQNSSDDNRPNQAAQFHALPLHSSHLSPNPISQFHAWFTDPALQSSIPETCTLSTAHLPSGRVSSRTVYLKELDARGGFVIYSNWATSRKARDVESNGHVALCFWWKAIERQVRVEGVAERVAREESQRYFGTRVRGSKVGAWASRQSEVLRPRPEAGAGDGEAVERDDGRAQLEEQVEEVDRRFEGQEDIPVPEFWGGLRVIPDMIEFWQGRESRLHDRFRYLKIDPGQATDGTEWKIERLSP